MPELVGYTEITEILHSSLARQFADLMTEEDGSTEAVLADELPGLEARAREDLLRTILSAQRQMEEEEAVDDSVRAAIAVSILSIGYQLGREVQRREEQQ